MQFNRQFAAVCVAAVVCAALPAQIVVQKPGEEYAAFLKGNDTFGLRLLEQIQKEDPEHNVVLAPLPLTILLGAIQEYSARAPARDQLGEVFGWGPGPDLAIPSKMILGAMDPPKKPEATGTAAKVKRPLYEPDELWIENRLLYRTPKGRGELLAPRFRKHVSEYFGLQLVNTGNRLPSKADLESSRTRVGALPEVNPLDQVWLSSGIHLRATWEELFMESEPEPWEFHTESGKTVPIKAVQSGIEKLLYLKSDQIEAVVLPCGRVDMIIVLPKAGMKISELERMLVANPEVLDALQPKLGVVHFPIFEIKALMHLEKALQEMGVKDIFEHLDGITARSEEDKDRAWDAGNSSRITDIGQKADFAADKHGIHADAETLVGAIPLGILMADDVFRMSLDRPFVFIVREHATGAMLFVGSLMEPGAAQ
jgi:serpin B